MSHGIVKCLECQRVISQCRCMHHNDQDSWEVCEQCKTNKQVSDAVTVEVEAVSTESFVARVEELKALGAGWLDGVSGEALNPAAVETVARILLELHEQEDMPLPHLYPTEEGYLQAEWTIGTWELSAVVCRLRVTLETDLVAGLFELLVKAESRIAELETKVIELEIVIDELWEEL